MWVCISADGKNHMMYIMYSVSKKTIMFCVISSTKHGQFWRNLVHHILNKFAAKSCKCFHLTWIMSLHCVVKLEMLIGHVIPLSCHRKKPQNLSLNCGLQICQIWIQHVGTTAKEGVRNIHHWTGRTETATKDRVGQAGSWRYCGSHREWRCW